jgi:GT2 family glycosyltransferase
MPHVTIIVLNWNGKDQTLDCLASLAQLDYPQYGVVLVDNASRDGSVEAVKSIYPDVKIIQNKENLGFAQGNNVGIEYALAENPAYILLLNNDTVVAADFLKILVEAAESHPDAGIVGPSIYYFDRPQTIWSAGGAIDWKQGSTRMLHLNEEDCGQLGIDPHPVDFVTGCALLVKVPALRRAGCLDPRFFAYFEETEWCVRVAQAGYRVLHVPRAHIWHRISLQEREVSPLVQYYMTRNRLLFLQCARAGLLPLARTLLFDYGRTLLSWSFRPKWAGKSALRKAMLIAILDWFRNRFGRVDLPL